jgi:WhiB family redox-sensing transcriptional regulator
MAEPDFDSLSTSRSSQAASAFDFVRRSGPRITALPADRNRWMLRGACRREDPELFFPLSASGPSQVQISAAKAVCARCPVRANCLSYALITQPDGIWGGTTTEERWRHSPTRGADRPSISPK